MSEKISLDSSGFEYQLGSIKCAGEIAKVWLWDGCGIAWE